MTGKQAAKYGRGLICFIKVILPPSVNLSLRGAELCGRGYEGIRVSTTINSSSHLSPVLVCSLSPFFHQAEPENHERKAVLRGDNQHFFVKFNHYR